jgi:ATP-dependent exoDNAse (exonuclease V) beta subunit
MAPEAAALLAREILPEVAACRDDAFLGPLLTLQPPAGVSEWLLEDQPSPGVIRRGKLDRLALRGKDWWLLDYKTSRPEHEKDWEDFMRQEAEKYRPQLLAYREMVAKARGLAPEAIRLALYFTACRKVVQL